MHQSVQFFLVINVWTLNSCWAACQTTGFNLCWWLSVCSTRHTAKLSTSTLMVNTIYFYFWGWVLGATRVWVYLRLRLRLSFWRVGLYTYYIKKSHISAKIDFMKLKVPRDNLTDSTYHGYVLGTTQRVIIIRGSDNTQCYNYAKLTMIFMKLDTSATTYI